LPFAPAQVTTGYLQWPLLPELFLLSFPGVNTSRDADLVDIDRRNLEKRISTYFDKDLSDNEVGAVAPSLLAPSTRYDPKATRQHLLQKGISSGYFVSYSYRPFDVRSVYWHPETKLLDEKREDLFKAFRAGNVFLTSRQKGERQVEGTPFYATSYLPDRHLTRPGSICIPLTGSGFAPHLQSQLGDSASGDEGAQANLSTPVRSYLTKLGLEDVNVNPQSAASIWMHALAIGYSPAYLSENADGIRQEWPRIPLPDRKEALLASAALGQQIAGLLDTETPFVAPASSRQASGTLALQKIATFTLPHGTTLDERKHFAVTAGWGHAGKGGITMPGKGKVAERDYTAVERNAGFQPAPGQSRQDVGVTLGDRTCDVYLNDVAYWSNIPVRVWEYTIGGYQVMKKWLSYREEKLLGRPLTKDEVRYVQEMARRIAALILLEPALNANYRNVKDHSYDWPREGR
jgi:hypothetical protein